jgi:hypothetical protein
MLFDAVGFYRWVFTKNAGAGYQMFACLDSVLSQTGPRTLELEVRIREGYRRCPEFFYVGLGCYRAMPTMLGLPPAEVQIVPLGQSARYIIKVPPGGGILARIKNALVPDKEGTWTLHFPTGEIISIYDAAMRYIAAGTPLIILTGKEYGTGSSRDWAAKGPALLGVKAVIAESYERIHRSNLVGMGVLPLAYEPGSDRKSLGLTGVEEFSITGIASGLTPGGRVTVTATAEDGRVTTFPAVVRLNSPFELDY